MSENARKLVVIAVAAMALIAMAYWVGGLLFGGGGDAVQPRFNIARTDDNNIICFDCRHRFALTWEQLGRQAAAGRTAAGGSAPEPVTPPACPSCGEPHLRYQVVNCPSRGIVYVAITPTAPTALDQAQLDTYCK